MSMRPTALPWLSVNHSAPSGPAVIIDGIPGARGTPSISPWVVMRPTRSEPIAVYQSARSGPATIPNGALPAANANVRCSPSGVMRPIAWSPERVNQKAPSPAAMTEGLLSGAPRS